MAADDVRSREEERSDKRRRADALRNVDTVLKAAIAVFDKMGVDAPMRTIAAQAGVGVGTIYRHFPQRSDLIKAIIRREVDDCVEAAATLRREMAPIDALYAWVQTLVDLAGTKRGLGPALHSGDAAYEALPNYVMGQLTPALRDLLDDAASAGDIGGDVDAAVLLPAAMRLATAASEGQGAEARRMVTLLIDGLRYRATTACHDS